MCFVQRTIKPSPTSAKLLVAGSERLGESRFLPRTHSLKSPKAGKDWRAALRGAAPGPPFTFLQQLFSHGGKQEILNTAPPGREENTSSLMSNLYS